MDDVDVLVQRGDLQAAQRLAALPRRSAELRRLIAAVALAEHPHPYASLTSMVVALLEPHAYDGVRARILSLGADVLHRLARTEALDAWIRAMQPAYPFVRSYCIQCCWEHGSAGRSAEREATALALIDDDPYAAASLLARWSPDAWEPLLLADDPSIAPTVWRRPDVCSPAIAHWWPWLGAALQERHLRALLDGGAPAAVGQFLLMIGTFGWRAMAPPQQREVVHLLLQDASAIAPVASIVWEDLAPEERRAALETVARGGAPADVAALIRGIGARYWLRTDPSVRALLLERLIAAPGLLAQAVEAIWGALDVADRRRVINALSRDPSNLARVLLSDPVVWRMMTPDDQMAAMAAFRSAPRAVARLAAKLWPALPAAHRSAALATLCQDASAVAIFLRAVGGWAWFPTDFRTAMATTLAAAPDALAGAAPILLPEASAEERGVFVAALRRSSAAVAALARAFHETDAWMVVRDAAVSFLPAPDFFAAAALAALWDRLSDEERRMTLQAVTTDPDAALGWMCGGSPALRRTLSERVVADSVKQAVAALNARPDQALVVWRNASDAERRLLLQSDAAVWRGVSWMEGMSASEWRAVAPDVRHAICATATRDADGAATLTIRFGDALDETERACCAAALQATIGAGAAARAA